MIEASLVGVLRFLLIFVLIYYGFKLLARFVFPLLIKKYVEKKQEKFHEQYKQQHGFDEGQHGEEGEVRIKYKPENKKKKSKSKEDPHDDGEYVDYEEIE